MKLLQCLSLAFVCLLAEARAQRQIEVRAVLNDPVNGSAEFQVQTAPKVFNKLPLVAEGLGATIKVTLAQNELTLHGPFGSDPNIPPPVIASATVPATAQRCIVVIAPEAKGGKLPYRAIALDDSPQAFPFGESRIVNLTPVTLAMQAGTIKRPLPAGQIASLPEIKDVNEFNVAQTNFYAKAGEDWQPFTERQLQYVKTMRRVFITYASPGAMAPSVRTIADHEPLPPPRPAQ
ncbi:hypothetical protein KBB96_13095 [Luteolibacter ambystomatis]|uniref:Uncharacterized protein n=1 Tax=Luteolibacter ambystomatis TaxID=2824561 RepID=A0A975G6R9_9BACT|nr:hypothetical protein [Luteolibacter ambystomatis]QUE49806.1 hypothetical protein KBB96_13095 [Luteolibacter ambystomatis]